jgi:hypothetical protein
VADPIRFKDMGERNQSEDERLRSKLAEFKRRGLTTQAGELDKILKAHQVVRDPLYVGLQDQFKAWGQPVGDAIKGFLPSQQKPPAGAAVVGRGFSAGTLTDVERAFAGVYGILLRDGRVPPALDDPDFGKPDEDRNQRFAMAAAEARGEYAARFRLYDKILPILVRIGDRATRDVVEAAQWASVSQSLFNQGIDSTDFQLALKVEATISGSDGFDGTRSPPSSINIDLPDLDAQVDIEIREDNLNATQAIYFAASLEELKVFQVVERVIETFHQGMLPISKGRGGDLLYRFWRKSVQRMTEFERRNLYARTFGIAGGDAQVIPNREFNDLWLRFLSAVSSFNRQRTVNDLLTMKFPAALNQEGVRKSGRDLGANLSLHGFGVAYFAATELQEIVKDSIEILSNPDITNAYGARDMWQVVDQVATLELGGAKDSIRYRTMAQSGAVVIRWLANHADVLATAGNGPVLDVEVIADGAPRLSGDKPTTNPNDQDLVNACEQWLAVTGTQDEQVEQYAQPVEGPVTTSRPIQIPAVAKDLLASVGVSPDGQ